MNKYENLYPQFIRVGHEKTVSSLIQSGANVNEMNDGETALHVAVDAGNS